MCRGQTAKRLVFGTTRALVAYKIGICAAKTSRTHCLVGVDHDMLVGCFLYGIKIVTHRFLVVVVFSLGKNVADVAALYRVITVFVHQVVGAVHIFLVVRYRAGGLMMHHQLYTL